MLKAIFALLAASSVTSSAYMGEVVNSFPVPAPGFNTSGLGHGQKYLYAYVKGRGGYELDPDDGWIISSWPEPVPYVDGLTYTYDGLGHNYVWLGKAYPPVQVYQCNPTSGSIYASWGSKDAHRGLAPLCTADGGYRPTALFVAVVGGGYRRIYRYTTTGSFIATIYTQYDGFSDIAYDHRNKLIWRNYTDQSRMDGHTTEGSFVTSFRTSFVPSGVAYYNQYLFLASGTLIFKIHCPATVSVRPASLGRVKALFR